MKLNNKTLQLAIHDIFIALFVLFAVFVLMELIKPRIVLNYINLDIHLLLLIIFGVMAVMIYPLEVKKNKIKFWEHIAVFILTILLGILAIYFTRSIGWLSILLGIVSFIIAYFFIILNLEGR
jgi:hypothetical protein